MDPLLTVSMAATGGALTATWPTIALLYRARRDLHRAQRALDHDDLTGLASRRAFATYLDAVRAARRRSAVILIDLDRFKQVNDRYGHHAGDDVLCQVAERLRALGGEVWLAARLAGDEFVLVVNADKAAAVAERIRGAIGATPFAIGDHRITVTASVGFAAADDPNDQEILRRADLAMYQDKAAGRRGGRQLPGPVAPDQHIATDRRGRRTRVPTSRPQIMPVASQPASTTTT